ncbi:hypothetical protein NIES37_19380 [Tolypothrix tenuis PCC 7101]|uniref:Uncharacterized protein n=1 Tax=Tolypothrix tenuis PCC 7101 TaxID=231146 RepID=A0A1Z4MX20_9CYAN|nr:hypothetical protein NIES37_19380 [Tolypothrix tenuis PCC 7101]BAZ71503.1 hypothetical protein NIES50_00460 [Aulosira laxa NIES-50]
MLAGTTLYNNFLANVKIHLIVQNEQKNHTFLVKKVTNVSIVRC